MKHPKPHARILNFLAFASCLWLIAATSGFGQTFTWTGSTSSDSSLAGNWAPAGGPPGSSNNVYFTNGTSVDVDFTTTLFSVANFTYDRTSGSQTFKSSTNPAVFAIGGNLTNSGPANLTFRNASNSLSLTVAGNMNLGAGSNTYFGANNSASTTSSTIDSVTVAGATNIQGTLGFARVSGTINLGSVVMNGGTLNPLTGNAAGRGSLDGTITTINMSRLQGAGIITGAKVSPTATTTGVITISGTENGTFSGTISNGQSFNVLSLTKAGSSTQILSGSNTYTGSTTVNAGTLLINGAGSLAAGSVVTANGGELGGSGRINGAVSIAGAATLLGGDGTVGTSLTLSNNLSLADNSVISLALGAGGSHSSLIRTGGNWSFDGDQAFELINLGATSGMYTGLITGLASDPGVTNWTIVNSGWVGGFSYNAGSVNLNLTAVPEPAVGVLLGMGLLAVTVFRKRRRS